jgi:hypothetical protein
MNTLPFVSLSIVVISVLLSSLLLTERIRVGLAVRVIGDDLQQ